MKTFAIASALILAAAAPALANTQLERSLGVEPGVYTLAELVELKDKSTMTGNEGRVFLGEDLVARGGNADVIWAIASAHAAESDDSGERGRVFGVQSDIDGSAAAKIRSIVADTFDSNPD